MVRPAHLLPVVVLLAAESDLSFDEIRSMLCEALVEQFGRDIDGCARFYLYETFPEYVIARGPEAALYRVPYTISADGVTFGEAQQVETAYVPVAESCEFLANESEASTDDAYPIIALRAGWGKGVLAGETVPHYYPPAFVARVAEALNGAPFGRRHPDQRGSDPTGSSDASRIAGYLEGGELRGDAAVSTVKLFSAESDLRSRLNEARTAKRLGLFAVSMLASIGYKAGVVEGKQCLIAESLGTLYSIDLCQRAGAGGQFLSAASYAGVDVAAAQLAAVKPNSTTFAPRTGRGNNQGPAGSKPRGKQMNKMLQQLLEALSKKDATKANAFYSRAVVASESEQDVIQGEVITALSDANPTTTTTLAAESAATLLEAQRTLTRGRIESKLTESKLPEPAKASARRTLEVMLSAEANLGDDKIDAEIALTRTAFAAVAGATRVVAGGVTLDSSDKMALAMESMLGVTESKGKGVPAFRGIRDAYVQVSGDYNLDRLAGNGGRFLLASEAAVSADFPNLLLDAMHKLLMQEWAELALDGLASLYTTATVTDYKLQNRIRDGYFAELPIVGESNDYLEVTYPTDERVSYAVQKRGGLLSITEETIRNDDLGAIARWPAKLARAARWGLKNYITAFLASNQVYSADNLTWFHASHNNLLALPFGQDALVTAQTNLKRQTEKDSGEPLGLPLNWIAVPPELEAAAVMLNQSTTAGSNAFYQRFGANNERIFVNEKFSDTNDWYYGTNQTNAPFLEIGFLDGKEQPEIFLANQPTVGQQFLADEIQYKVKFVYNGAITDYRGIGKSVVTP